MKLALVASIGTILGIIMGLYLKSIAIFVLILIIILFISFVIRKHYSYFISFIISLSIFFTYTTFLENVYNKNYQELGSKEIKVQAVVISAVQEKEYKYTCEIKVTKIENIQNNFYNLKLLCNIKKGNSNQLEYGDKIEFTATYEVPSAKRNEGGFDYRQYLKIKGISGIVEPSNIQVVNKNQESWIARKIYTLKNNLIRKIKDILKNETAGLCIGLLLGDKTLISEEIQNNFRESSLSHMLAISGAHMSYILLGITTFLNLLKLHKRWSKTAVIVFIIFFMALVGFTPSIMRAGIMAILNLTAGILLRKPNVFHNLAISSIIILLLNPYSLLDIGFQLSFGGTLGIILFSTKESKQLESKKTKILNNIKQIILVSVSANVIILPIMVYHFNNISLTFLISNVLASPVLALCLIMGMVFIVAIIVFNPIAVLISYFLKPILKILILIAKLTSKIPYSQILVATPSIWQITFYYILIYLKKVKKYPKFVFIILIVILIFTQFITFPNSNLKIHFVDVGQGDSTLIKTPSGKTVLVDGGGSEIGSFNVGEKTLIPYLLDKNITKLDYMMFSHFDSDHCQGLLEVLKELKVKNIIISKQGENSSNFKELLQILQTKKVNVIIAKAGDKINVDKQCYFDILFPENNLISENILNNNSIVAKFYFNNNFSILFTGDIEKIAENRLIELYGNSSVLNSTILKIAHHGSKTSSTEQLLKIIKPKIALIGVGEKNKFGHPSKLTIQNLENLRCINI